MNNVVVRAYLILSVLPFTLSVWVWFDFVSGVECGFVGDVIEDILRLVSSDGGAVVVVGQLY